MMQKQNENINRDRKYKKEPNMYFEAEEYSNWIEKNSLEGFDIRFNQAEERISKRKDRSFEIIQSEEQKENRMKKSEERLTDVQDTTSRLINVLR